jgi:hypothetical protein
MQSRSIRRQDNPVSRMVKKLKLPKDRQFVELRCKLAEAPENVR